MRTSPLDDLTAAGTRTVACGPWSRSTVRAGPWRRAIQELEAGRLSLASLWAEPGLVHLALLDEPAARLAVLTYDASGGSYPDVGSRHAPALRLERTVHDLYGLRPGGSPDRRPWLDHGHWGVRHPLAEAPDTSPAAPPAYAFLPSEGEGLHQIPVGPVHAGIIEPGHFRFTANGEAVVRLEARLGYVHKGIDGLMVGAELARAAQLASRVSGDSTVAYAFAFARAVEAAIDLEVPARAVWLRALMAELERLANHLGDIGAICNDAAFPLLHTHTGLLREQVLRASEAAFGHRLMRDRIVPGGVDGDLDDTGAAALRTLLDTVPRSFERIVELYDGTPSLLDRTVTTGRLDPVLARRFAAGGYVGRASGRLFDARKALTYAPYDQLTFDVPVREAGDVDARIWIRIEEVRASLGLLRQLLDGLPSGGLRTDVPADAAGEGLALVEGFRGDLLAWLRLEGGRVARCHLRDPSWFQWPLLEAAIAGNIVADFPLCNKSFNCSYSGHDL